MGSRHCSNYYEAILMNGEVVDTQFHATVCI